MIRLEDGILIEQVKFSDWKLPNWLMVNEGYYHKTISIIAKDLFIDSLREGMPLLNMIRDSGCYGGFFCQQYNFCGRTTIEKFMTITPEYIALRLTGVSLQVHAKDPNDASDNSGVEVRAALCGPRSSQIEVALLENQKLTFRPRMLLRTTPGGQQLTITSFDAFLEA
mgnify:CR=1 FL=1